MMFHYTDTILSVMQRVEVYNEIFVSVCKEIQEFAMGQMTNQRSKDTYIFCRNNVGRFLIEEEQFRKNLIKYHDKQATQLLLQGLEEYKEGVYHWLTSLSETCEVTNKNLYQQGLAKQKASFVLINQACKKACAGIESAHSVHKM